MPTFNSCEVVYKSLHFQFLKISNLTGISRGTAGSRVESTLLIPSSGSAP